MGNASSTVTLLTVVFGLCLVLFGFCLLTALVTIPMPPLWLSVVATIVGLTMIGPSEPKLQIGFGFLFFGLGAFTGLRTLDVITKPWLKYGLGASLLLIGVITIIYSAIGGASGPKDPTKTNDLSEKL